MRECIIYETMNIIGKKWTLLIIFEIYFHNRVSFNELKNAIKNITPKMLSKRLKELERDKIIIKKTTSDRVRSTYALTKRGEDLVIILNAIKKWSMKWLSDKNDCDSE